MTPKVKNFIATHKDKLTGKVLEVGSLEVNGSVRDVIPVTVGVDIRKGNGVDLVCDIKDLPAYYTNGYFDACVSTETLEHVSDWKAFIRVTWDMVKEGGWLLITMAARCKGRHAYPDDYWRFDEQMIRKIYTSADVVDLAPVSIGWIVQKHGELGDLDFTPYIVP